MRKFSVESGFTILELLVSMTILITVGTLVFSVLIATIRSTGKVNSTQLIKQNGNDILTQVSRMVQFSQRFEGVSTDGVTYTTLCETPTTGTGTATQYKYVRFMAFDEGVTVFACSTNPETIASNSASLIDTNNYAITNCSFTCTQIAPESPQTIGISFNLGKKNPGSFLDDPNPIRFTTSVTLRNY